MPGKKESKKKRNKRRTAAAVRTMTQAAKDDMLLQKTGFGGFFAPPDGNQEQKLQGDDASDDDYDDFSEIEESLPSVKAHRPEGMTSAAPSSPASHPIDQCLGWPNGNFIIHFPDSIPAPELMPVAGMGSLSDEVDATTLVDGYLQNIQTPSEVVGDPTNPTTDGVASKFAGQLADATERDPGMVEDIRMESAERQIAAADRQASATERLVQLQTEASDKRQAVDDARLWIEERRLALEERRVTMQEQQAERSALFLERIAAAEERQAVVFEDVKDALVSAPSGDALCGQAETRI